MKLLFDENLSPLLPAMLEDCYAESRHVRDLGLKTPPDADLSHLDRTRQLLDEES